MVDDCVTVRVVILCDGVTVVEVVVDAGRGVDDVLAGGAVDVDGEGSGVDVVWGEIVVTTMMAGMFPSMAVTRLEIVEMAVFMSVMEVFTREMDDWRDFIIWSRAAKSGVAVNGVGVDGGHVNAGFHGGEEVADEVAAAAEVVAADEVEATAVAAALAMTAAAAAAAAS
ncbi:hypothetical protein CBR_g49139 [Chara braunii]|uniref:Uncharacterized protein n=1 Tax=Chara braunii TaxID=69332 RepID=A0A388K4U3_CHABU|nr:hypothetical protein CBR_g49139 [Chara braunii]|eukprot:GBG65067.1 hypothetical protein CBR_g49139 [Chara braunii]